MSEQSKTTLKPRLLELNCHFTWRLLEEDCDIVELEERLHNQIEYLLTENKYMVHNLLAYAEHLKGDYPEAIANLEKAEEQILKANSDETNRKCLVTYGNYAWVYYHTKQYEKAQIYIDKVASIFQELKSSSQDSSKLPEIYGEQGWSLLKFCGQYYAKSKECFEKALETDPDDPEWNSGYATVVYRMEGFNGRRCPADECKSVPLLQRAVKLNPKDSVVKALLGLKLQDLNQVTQAQKYIEEALEQTPNLPYVLRYVAKFYRRAGKTEEALKVLKRAIGLTPTSGFLHHQIGLCYRQKMIRQKNASARYGRSYSQNTGNHSEEVKELIQKAIFHFEMALEHKKTFIFAYTDLANMYTEAKRYHKAEETFKKALDIKKLTEEEKQQIHFNYGRFLENYMRSETEAVKHYREALLISELTRERQSSEVALKRLADRMVKRDASDATGFCLLGFLYKLNQNTRKAIECYEKASELDPDNEEYLSVLCDLKLTI
ncbi:interferon-induced protein with tetratricopeptide repeats 5-like [Ascaphus truei]|uniref:interferon-induced protein with tetratricopeptide repeats 5-like n=1 Tax=Ascaphus truei TaxID=8439 RepID=UPI003F5A2BE6